MDSDRMIFRRHKRAAAATFLGRMARHVGGNTLAMMAIAIVPLAALAGSAIDTSRLYFVKVRLQQACDAGALAGRKFMVGTDYSTNANAQAQNFFANNFKAGTYGSTAVAGTFTKTADNQVAGTATATVPMTIMKMFGAGESVIAVTCEAKLEIPNLDVMFVLDTTNSMGSTNPSDTVSRIAALRSAVVSFYDTLEAAKTTSAQTRYGFVPYSSTVNVGLLLKREWMVDTWTYQSREPADITYTKSTSTGPAYLYSYGPWSYSGEKNTFVTYGDPENCAAPSSTMTNPATYTAWVPNGDGTESRTATQIANGSSYSATLSNGVCTINETRYKDYKQVCVETRWPNPDAGKKTETTTPVYWWNYKPVSYDVSSLKGSLASGLMAGGTYKAKIDGGNTAEWKDRSFNWNSGSACIEERQTVRQSDYPTLPAEALDLDIDKEPRADHPEEQWKPWMSNLVFARSYGTYTNANPTVNTANWPTNVTTPVRYNGGYANLSGWGYDYAACPSAARKLAVMNRGTVVSYMNGLKVAGRTYHDIGFLWGLRLMSPTGLFKTENATAPNGSQIARNLIFMTDGQTETNFADYDAYGLAAIDRRRTDASRLPNGDAEQDTIVENRLTALCRAAQGRDTTVWVIAFGTDLTPLLSGCASPGNHAFQANNAAELNAAFAAIAANIAKLRISK